MDAGGPEQTMDYSPAFDFGGQGMPMGGDAQGSTIEIGLDLTDITEHVSGDGSTFFLIATSNGAAAQINSLTLMDYRGGLPAKEIQCSESDVSFGGTSKTMKVSVEGNMTVSTGKPASAFSPKAGNLVVSPSTAGSDVQTLNFSFPNTSGSVRSLSIVDLSGKTIRSASQFQKTASGSVSWNLKDADGKRVSPGMYIAACQYELTGGSLLNKSARFCVVR
jgi:hypothetical protein